MADHAWPVRAAAHAAAGLARALIWYAETATRRSLTLGPAGPLIYWALWAAALSVGAAGSARLIREYRSGEDAWAGSAGRFAWLGRVNADTIRLRARVQAGYAATLFWSGYAGWALLVAAGAVGWWIVFPPAVVAGVWVGRRGRRPWWTERTT